MPDIAQSLPICILLSALGGAVEVTATAVLAYREADERRTGKEWRKLAQSQQRSRIDDPPCYCVGVRAWLARGYSIFGGVS